MFIPSVLSELFDDTRVLVAISWTYIIIAEMLNMNRGIGAALYESTRQSRIDETFALLIVIIVIGIVQDSMFKWLDTILFKHKRNTEKK